ncbi:putative pyridoxal reductase [[Candida] jaroonii]|uniref:Pyridoxal reductase n=1 Tax=[Candida] jaroonii TaxID=467808 RepID=A0ACA9YF11_9ASCO|nr:putative pyridoxal reductase [[Candida] jaroonii]
MSIQIPDKAYGTLSLTWTKTPPPREESLKILKYLYEKHGVRHFNGGMIYQVDPAFNNLKLLAEFFKSFDSSDCILSYKGGVDPATYRPSSSPEFLDSEFKAIGEAFEGTDKKPKIIFNIARIDKSTPIEDVAKYLDAKVAKDDYVVGWGLSEVGPETLKKAIANGKVSLLELEFSMLTQDILEMGTLKIASENEIPIICYSPIGRGLLTEKGVSPGFLESLAPTDGRIIGGLERFKPENYEANHKYLKELHDYAHEKKNCTLEQLALGYLSSMTGKENFKGIAKVTKLVPLPGSAKIANIDQLYDSVELTAQELLEVQEIIDSNTVQGARYNARLAPLLHG